MTISFIANTVGTAGTPTLPAHAAGDLIVVMINETTGSTTLIAQAGWNLINGPGFNNPTPGIFWKTAATSSEDLSGITNAIGWVGAVYRSDSGNTLTVNSVASTLSIGSTTITYPAIASMKNTSGTSWSICCSYGPTSSTPTGHTNRGAATDAYHVALHDSNAGVSTMPSVAATVASGAWAAFRLEAFELAPNNGAVSYTEANDNLGHEGTLNVTEANDTLVSANYTDVKIIGSNTSSTTTVTVPPHIIGDYIIIWAFRDGSATPPTLPAGYTTIVAPAGTTCSARLGYKIATATNDTSGTWTNATELQVAVARTEQPTAIGASANSAGTATSVTYPSLTLDTQSHSRVFSFAGHRSTDTTLESPPTGGTLLGDLVDATAEVAGFYSASSAGSWAPGSVAVGGTASGWVTASVEIKAAYNNNGAASYTEAGDYVRSTNMVDVHRVSANSASGTTAGMPPHQVGDALVVWSYRDGVATAPTLVAGYTSVVAPLGTLTAGRLAYKIATSNTEVTGTWTNATEVEVAVYRSINNLLAIGSSANSVGTTTSWNLPALTLADTSGHSIVTGWSGHRSIDTNLEVAPTGMVTTNTLVDATAEIASYQTTGEVSSFSSATKTLTGTASGWVSASFELRAIQPNNGAVSYTEANDIVVATNFIAPVLVGSSAGTTTATMPPHQPGDLIFAFAFCDGSATPPVIDPTVNWTQLDASGGTAASSAFAVQTALSNDEIVGNWTGASRIAVYVFRPIDSSYGITINPLYTVAGGTGTSVDYPDITLTEGGGSGKSYLFTVAGHCSVDTSLETPPTGFTLIRDDVDATAEVAGFYKKNVTSGTIAAVSVGGTSAEWRAITVEFWQKIPVNGAWDSLALDSSIYTNGDRTATGIIQGPFAVATNGFLSSSKTYGEVSYDTLTVPGSTNVITALVDPTTVDFFAWYANGNVLTEKSGVVASNTLATTLTTGDVLCIAVDNINHRIWGRKNSGNWNNSGTADPATNIGGYSCSTGSVFELEYINGDTSPADKVTLNATFATFAYPMPFGFVPLYGPAGATAGSGNYTEANDTLSSNSTLATSGVNGSVGYTEANDTLSTDLALTITADADDGMYADTLGWLGNTETIGWGMAQGYVSVFTEMGVRYNTVNIPQGSYISSAVLHPVVGTVVGSGPFGNIYGIAEDNLAAFDLSHNPFTITHTVANTQLTTLNPSAIDVTAQVQEIINRSGWAVDNSLGFAGDNSAAPSNYVHYYDWEADPTKVTTLTITYKATGLLAINGSASFTNANDTLSSASALALNGSVSYTESNDSISSNASVNTNGVVAYTEASDTVSSTATLALSATLAQTEQNDTLSSASVLALSGSATYTEANDTLSATTVILVNGSVSYTEANDTLSSASALAISANGNYTEQGDFVYTLTATLALSANGNYTEANDILISTGTGSSSGSVTYTEANDTLASGSILLLNGSVSYTEANDTGVESGTLAISSTLSYTEASDSSSISGVVAIAASTTYTEANDTVASTGTVAITANGNYTEANDTLVSASTLAITGSFSVTEQNDSISVIAVLAINGAVGYTEASDSSSIDANLLILGAVGYTEASDSSSIIATLPILANGNHTNIDDMFTSTAVVAITSASTITEQDDALSANGVLPLNGSTSYTEANDSVVSAAVLPIDGQTSIIEVSDTVSSTGILPINGVVDIVEASDGSRIIGKALPSGDVFYTEDDDLFAATGVVPITGLITLVEQNDTTVIQGKIAITGHSSISEDNDSAVGLSQLLIQAHGDISEYDPNNPWNGDFLEARGEHAIRGQIVYVETADHVQISAKHVRRHYSMPIQINVVNNISTPIVAKQSTIVVVFVNNVTFTTS